MKFLPGVPRRLASGAVELQVSAEPGRQVSLEAATSIKPTVWQPLGTGPSTDAKATFTDLDAAKFPQRF